MAVGTPTCGIQRSIGGCVVRWSSMLLGLRALVGALTGLLLLSLASAPALAAPPSQDQPGVVRGIGVHWRTLKTAHFRIHFYEEIRHLAERTAVAAERAHARVTRYLNWLPRGRIDITLVDNTDSANGFASSLPYNFIWGFAVPPEPLSSLNDFDDWLHVLVTHELTHVVHLDTISGLPRAINLTFGKLLAPNLVQPNWFIEGLAVLMESDATTGGRLRSAIYDMYLRSAVLEGRFHSLSAVSNHPLVFPQAEAAYLYGGYFVKYLEDRFGPKKIAEISHRYSRLFLPFALNRVARQSLGVRYDQLWNDWHASLKRRYAVQEDEVRRRGLTPARRLTFHGDGPRGAPSSGLRPRFLPDGRVVYLRETTKMAPKMVALDLASGATEELLEAFSTGGPAPVPNGSGIVFSQVNPQALPRRIGGADYAMWDDLKMLNLRDRSIRLVTSGQRAHHPDVSPDGERIACTVGSAPGSQQLAVVPAQGGAPEVLIQNGAGEIAYSPAWSPDGKLIAYSRFKPGGFHDIHVFDLETRTDRPLMVDRALDIEPRFSPDGRYVLWSSDRTGIYNVFAYELATSRVFQVTNVLGGAFQPAVSPDGKTLVFSGFSAAGFDLYATPFAPGSWQEADPFVNPRDDAPTPDAPSTVVTHESAYRAWRYLYPRAWGPPTFTRDDAGLGTAVYLSLNISDPAALHNIGLEGYLPFRGHPSGRVSYYYQRFWPSLGFSASRVQATAYDLYLGGVQQPYLQQASTLVGSVRLPVLRQPAAYGNLDFSYRYLDYGPATAFPVANPLEERTLAPEVGPNTDFFIHWDYSNVRAWALSISPQKGRRIALDFSVSDPSIGSKFRTVQLSWNWAEYLTPPWSNLHALALLYSGGVGIGDKRALFGIGGFVQQDIFRALFYQRRQCCLFLRGYPSSVMVGDQYHVASVEYRAPLLLLERGYATFPIYLRRIHGAVFADAGKAFFGDLKWGGFRYGVGAELRLDLKLAYYVETIIQLGVAHGLSEGGVTDYYWVSAIPF